MNLPSFLINGEIMTGEDYMVQQGLKLTKTQFCILFYGELAALAFFAFAIQCL